MIGGKSGQQGGLSVDEKTLAVQIRAILTQIEARQAIHSRPVFATLHNR